jgi:stearoyl-CoA desaturase (delta-9 desaturase)
MTTNSSSIAPLTPAGPKSAQAKPEVPSAEFVNVPWLTKATTLFFIIVPLLATFAAPFFFHFSWLDAGLLLGFYVISMMGITVGFHRLFTHASFETPTWVKCIFAIFGSMALQGSLFDWVATHRRHHQFSDTKDDPHSPHHHGTGVWALIKGAYHSHIGWFFEPEPVNMGRYIKDLRASRALRIINALFPLWVVIALLLPGILGGLLSQSWKGALTGFLWGGLVRVFLVHHVTWSINSACHIWGSRPFPSKDLSRNNMIFGILALGEGWHNTHHAFPRSARHGLRWWEIDGSYGVIRLLSLFGLAWDIRLPDAAALASASSTKSR